MSRESLYFDPSTVERSSFDVLPVGTYTVQATKIERIWKDSGDFMIKAEFSVLAPADFENRKVFENYNLIHEKDIAQKLGREGLAKLCDAIGVGAFDIEQISDDELNDMFLFKAFDAKIAVQKDKSGNYSDQNRIREYHQQGASPQKTQPQRPANNAPTGQQRQQIPSNQGQTQQQSQAGGRPPPNGRQNPWDRMSANR